MRVTIFGASVIGPYHREHGEQKQDAVLLRSLPGGWLGVVCDGVGSHPYSAWGARQACRAVWNVIAQAGSDVNVQEICGLVHSDWIKSLAPILPHQAGTTCLFAYIDRMGRAVCAQIGDGLILRRSSGKFQCISPLRRSFCDQTDSLGQIFSPENWTVHECNLHQSGDGILMMTDGVSDDIQPGAGEAFFDAVGGESFMRGSRMMRKWLTQQLHEWPTAHHSDDKTIAGIYRT